MINQKYIIITFSAKISAVIYFRPTGVTAEIIGQSDLGSHNNSFG
jgi:hypothetical protein